MRLVSNGARAAIFDLDEEQGQALSDEVGLTLPVARDLAYYGIRIVTIAPGVFDTPILKGLPDEARQSPSNSIPFPKRLGDVKDYADLVQHIVENPYLNGETLHLDGTLRMS